jgi:hypothetical protein
MTGGVVNAIQKLKSRLQPPCPYCRKQLVGLSFREVSRHVERCAGRPKRLAD